MGLRKVERCSGLLLETQRKTVRVSLSFLFDVSVGHPSSCHMEVVHGCFPAPMKNDPCSNVLETFQSLLSAVLHVHQTRSVYAIDEAVLCTACSIKIGLLRVERM